MSKGGGGVNIPKDYTVKMGGLDGGILQIDSDLDNIHVREFPALEYRLKEVPVMTLNSNVAVKELPPVNTNVAIKEMPVIRLEANTNLNVAIKEIPDTRVHLPAHYEVAFSLFGVEIFKVGFCGESQVINEKYKPRQTEICL